MMGIRADELMAELAKNEEFQAMRKAKDEHFAQLEKMYDEDEEQLVKELNQAGFSVTSVYDFVNGKNDYADALPILIKHLKIKHHPKILAGIARSLAVPEFASNDELWNLLADLYGKTPPNSAISIPEERGAQEAIAVALECLATESRVECLKKIVDKNPNGDGVHWLQDILKMLG